MTLDVSTSSTETGFDDTFMIKTNCERSSWIESLDACRIQVDESCETYVDDFPQQTAGYAHMESQ